MSTASIPLPRWIEIGLLPILNILLALLVSGLVILAIGENPVTAVQIMLVGAFGYDEAIGYTLYYTTNFIFTGLATPPPLLFRLLCAMPFKTAVYSVTITSSLSGLAAG